MIFKQSFAKRKSAVFGMFTRTIDAVQQLIEDADVEKRDLIEVAQDHREKAQDLEYEAAELQREQTELETVREKFKGLISA